MNILNTKSESELIQSLLAEVAKSRNELKCATEDLKKANGRLGFCVAVLNELINRQEI